MYVFRYYRKTIFHSICRHWLQLQTDATQIPINIIEGFEGNLTGRNATIRLTSMVHIFTAHTYRHWASRAPLRLPAIPDGR